MSVPNSKVLRVDLRMDLHIFRKRLVKSAYSGMLGSEQSFPHDAVRKAGNRAEMQDARKFSKHYSMLFSVTLKWMMLRHWEQIEQGGIDCEQGVNKGMYEIVRALQKNKQKYI
ncbi:MAG TPA: hypothetical protein DCZ91_16930 [Lachnospiraceae bacterium]|nr:hypothetical protein [Lachnospiraceae bacterium]